MCRSPSACKREVDQAVPGELLEHVIEKADAGRDLRGAAAVEIDPAGDPGFLGVAFDRRHPHDTLLECRACGELPCNNFRARFPLRGIRTDGSRA